PVLDICQGGVCACSFGIPKLIPDRDIGTSGHPEAELPKWLFASVAWNIHNLRSTLSLSLRRQIG
ncbi:MAG: hypothetical protein RJB02_1797, partial [Pseudomonadota bacterium]